MRDTRSIHRRLAVITAASLTAALVPAAAATATASTPPTDLFISEYVEGLSNNKAIEIYNGTGAPVDLAAGGYNVQMFFNGAVSASLTINLTGTVAAGDVYVLAQSSASAAILAQADQTNGSGWYNGDDAVVLRKGTTRLDVIGQVGFDPGSEWGTGLTSTADNSLRRKATITAGDPIDSDAFDPAAEWDGYATDTFDGLGSHTVEGGSTDAAPTVSATTPAAGSSNLPPAANLSVTFSEPVSVGAGAFSLSCAAGGASTLNVSGGPTTWVLDPSSDLASGDTCTLTVAAASVSDLDETDPPDTMAGDVVVSFTVGVDPCTVPITPIPQIQGSGDTVAETGSVTTRGVVVGDYEGASPNLRGFYIQDPTGDGDSATSDGIFVFEGSNADTVNVGDLVTVKGTAGENQGQSQVSAGTITVCPGGQSVQPTDVAFPLTSPTALEQYEGMLVRVPEPMTVTEHFQLGRFGQVVVSSGGRLQQPTNVVEPGAAATALQASNNLRRLIIDDRSQSQNPDPIVWGRDGEPLSAANTLRGGDTVTGATGVLTYTWAGNAASGNAYRLRPIGSLGGQATFVAGNPRPAAPEVGGSLQVAGMNVLNYFNTFTDCTNGVGGAPTDCRGAESTTEFDRQAAKTVSAITTMGAEVVGVIEIENDGYGSSSALADLVDRLNAVAGPGTWAYIDVDQQTGQVNALGTDAIKVGAIYQPAKVTPVGQTAVLNTESFVTGGDSTERNRPALAQAFRENATGAVFTAVVNHLKSKGSACDAPDAGDGQGNCNAVRTAAATELATWLAGDPTATGDKDVLILGDLNSYAMEDPIDALRGAGFTNLVSMFAGPDAYSYVFDGQWGYLDQALASASLTGQVTGVADWHVNADEPSVLDYNTNFKKPGQVDSLFAPDPFRNSDHDPVVVGLDLASFTETFTTGGGWITAPASGAFPAGKGELQFSAKYASESAAASGSLSYAVGDALVVSGTAVEWLKVNGSTATFGGPAQVNGEAGYTVRVTTTDGGKKADTFRVVVHDTMGLVYDSGTQTVRGSVVVHE